VNLEQFASRGLKAQQATQKSIAESKNVEWLQALKRNSDAPYALRIAADKRLRKLQSGRERR
jgi:hypothetical protein